MLNIKRELTCGLLITSPAGWFLAHATDTPYWDLPKGQREPDEDPLEAALRECWEETGLELSHLRHLCVPLGQAPYNKKMGKTLALFRLDLPDALDLSECACRSWVTGRSGGGTVLDMDEFAWVPEEKVPAHVKPRMAKYLRRQGLLA